MPFHLQQGEAPTRFQHPQHAMQTSACTRYALPPPAHRKTKRGLTLLGHSLPDPWFRCGATGSVVGTPEGTSNRHSCRTALRWQRMPCSAQPVPICTCPKQHSTKATQHAARSTQHAARNTVVNFTHWHAATTSSHNSGWQATRHRFVRLLFVAVQGRGARMLSMHVGSTCAWHGMHTEPTQVFVHGMLSRAGRTHVGGCSVGDVAEPRVLHTPVCTTKHAHAVTC